MLSAYATKDLMVHLHRANKVFYCPIKSNRKVDDSGGKSPYKAVTDLQRLIEHLLHVRELGLRVGVWRVHPPVNDPIFPS